MQSLSPRQLEALESRWITTIDSFVAASASTKEGREGMCRVLDIKAEELDALLRDACAVLGEERYRELLKGEPGGPIGALWNNDNKHIDDEPEKGKQEP